MSKRRWFQETFKPIANDWNQGATIDNLQTGNLTIANSIDIQGKKSFPSGDVTLMDLSSAQTISGTKTFTSAPLMTISQPSSANSLTKKQYVDSILTSAKSYTDSITNTALSNAKSYSDTKLQQISQTYTTINFNNITTPGIYDITISSTVTNGIDGLVSSFYKNKPITLTVKKFSVGMVQIINIYGVLLAERVYINSWSSWNVINYDPDELPSGTLIRIKWNWWFYKNSFTSSAKANERETKNFSIPSSTVGTGVLKIRNLDGYWEYHKDNRKAPIPYFWDKQQCYVFSNLVSGTNILSVESISNHDRSSNIVSFSCIVST